MPADASGRRLKVLAAGLAKLGAECETISAGLSADTAPSFVAASVWQSNAGAVNVAAAAARKDLAAIVARIRTRGTDYAAAGTRYTETEDASATRLRGLIG
jgi:hypothetical protein